jgi:hypothetical protein
MKCTHGLYGHAAFKNARAILFFKVVRNKQGAWEQGSKGGVPRVGPNPRQM